MGSLPTFRRKFDADHLVQISMPMGGIGAGCICLSGYGALQDLSIRNKPSTTALMDGNGNEDAVFAILHIKGEQPVTRLLEGPMPFVKVYDQGLQGTGYRKGGHEGFPRFASAEFESQFPSGFVNLTDDTIPLKVRIEGWSPFIPLDDVNSSIPVASLIYKFENNSDRTIDAEFSFHLSHLTPGKRGESNSRNEAVPGKGIFLFNVDDEDSLAAGSCALYLLADEIKIKAEWFRGGWFDGISALWKQVSNGEFVENQGSPGRGPRDGRNGGSVLAPFTLAPGQTLEIPVVLAWYLPHSNLNVGRIDPETKIWSPFYVSRWKSANEVAEYVCSNYKELKTRTDTFRDALYSSTVPDSVMDAVGSNLAILKSPTVLRQDNGNLWAWEGCFTDRGCCPGSCTHVWNYAQALPHLFPNLERTLRKQELERSMDDRGHINFRAALPDGPVDHEFHAAADGQLGGILKLFRDWQISGDSEWLETMFPLARKSLDYCIATWDPDRLGILAEPHHNTYDIEFWGPDGMCGSIYVGALAAMAEMADFFGDESASEYRNLSELAAKFLDDNLFNGEYYEQKVDWKSLHEPSFRNQVKAIEALPEPDEMEKLLLEEGPKYQYGSGCLSDGVIGAWMCEIYGVSTSLNRSHLRSHLQAIFRHNFRESLKDHPCPQRPGYAIGDEPGLLLCTWPRGGKPTLPFVYSDEVWTGIEYQVASHLISMGCVVEGLKIVESVRSRYDGLKRNPFNEYECGSYYARALASFALLGAYGGFRYSAQSRSMWLNPKTPSFSCFFATEHGFGTYLVDSEHIEVRVSEGFIQLETIYSATDSYSFESTEVTPDRPFAIPRHGHNGLIRLFIG